MSLQKILQAFLPSSPTEAVSLSPSDNTAENILTYLCDLITDKNLIADQLKQLEEAKKKNSHEREIAYIPIYFALETILTTQGPPLVKDLNTNESLRQKVKEHFDIQKLVKQFRIIFLPEKEQIAILFEISINNLANLMIKNLGFDHYKSILENAAQKTPLTGIVIKENGLDFTAEYPNLENVSRNGLTSSFKMLYRILYDEIIKSFGEKKVVEFIHESYTYIKHTYSYEFISAYLDIVPIELLENERIEVLSRQQVEEKVKEATDEERKRREQMEEQNKKLQESKRAMLNLLEDARTLEEELKKEKASVEHKVQERTHELQQEQARLEASINSLNVGFIMTGTDYAIIAMNGKAKRLLLQQHHNADAVISNIDILEKDFTFADIEKEIHEIIDLRGLIKQCIQQEKPIELKNIAFGAKYLRFYLAPIVTDENQKVQIIGSVILVEDITEEKVLERSRDEFFSIASHELRTPLTAIRGNTSLIQEYYKEVLEKDASLAEIIVDIHDSSIRLIQIVNDFLDVSRLEQGKINYKKEVFDLTKIIEKVVYEIGATAKERGIYVKPEHTLHTVPLVFADKDRTKQIVYNLVGNAVKFVDEGGVTVDMVEENGFVKVRVIDTGKGIPLNMQHLLFRKFQQAGASIFTRDTTPGTGLGLYISKLMVEGMGGKISLESSEENKGTTFSFTLPLATAEQQIPATDSQKPVEQLQHNA